jgi:hypothetical protein
VSLVGNLYILDTGGWLVFYNENQPPVSSRVRLVTKLTKLTSLANRVIHNSAVLELA